MKYLKYIGCIITGILVGVIISNFLLPEDKVALEVLKETFIYLNDEQQVARTEKGNKLYPLMYENHLYIPVTEKGYMLNDKEVEMKENRIDIKTVEVSSNIGIFETETLYGEKFSEKNIEGNKFTVILNWATWCPYCKEDLAEIEKVYKDYEKEGIQVIGLLVDEDYEEAKKLVSEKGITFTILKSNEELEKSIQSNMLSIPEFVILDKQGEIVTENINGEHNILYLRNSLDELIIEDCSKCVE